MSVFGAQLNSSAYRNVVSLSFGSLITKKLSSEILISGEQNAIKKMHTQIVLARPRVNRLRAFIGQRTQKNLEQTTIG